MPELLRRGRGVIPNRLHPAIVQRTYVDPRKEEDVFPIRYRCNTVYAVRRALDRHGFQHCVYGYQSDPAHFGFSRALYFSGHRISGSRPG